MFKIISLFPAAPSAFDAAMEAVSMYQDGRNCCAGALDQIAWRAIWFGDFEEKKWEVGRQILEGRRKKAEGHWNVDGLVIVVVRSGASGGLLWFVSCFFVVVLRFGGCLYVCLWLTATQAVKAMHMF